MPGTGNNLEMFARDRYYCCTTTTTTTVTASFSRDRYVGKETRRHYYFSIYELHEYSVVRSRRWYSRRSNRTLLIPGIIRVCMCFFVCVQIITSPSFYRRVYFSFVLSLLLADCVRWLCTSRSDVASINSSPTCLGCA